jgi:hypothetical protein
MPSHLLLKSASLLDGGSFFRKTNLKTEGLPELNRDRTHGLGDWIYGIYVHFWAKNLSQKCTSNAVTLSRCRSHMR